MLARVTSRARSLLVVGLVAVIAVGIAVRPRFASAPR
jgi:hypothetical protein